MKKTVILSTVVTLFAVLFFTACKKNNSASETFTEAAVHAADQSLSADAGDEFDTDAATATENVLSMSGNTPQGFFKPPCNATITFDTLNAAKTITITYNGLNCAGTRSRTGVVTISLPAGVQWKNTGAQLTVTYNALKITRVVDSKSITINGSRVITNVTGGLLRNLASLGTITHTISSSNMSLTFDDGTQRTWQVAKKRVFTYNNGMVITTSGNYNDGTYSGISEWGTNRFGNAFVTTIQQPLIIRQDCNFRLTAGEVKHSKLTRTITTTFGLDAAGNPTSCPGLAPFYMKVVWVNAVGTTITSIHPY